MTALQSELSVALCMCRGRSCLARWSLQHCRWPQACCWAYTCPQTWLRWPSSCQTPGSLPQTAIILLGGVVPTKHSIKFIISTFVGRTWKCILNVSHTCCEVLCPLHFWPPVCTSITMHAHQSSMLMMHVLHGAPELQQAQDDIAGRGPDQDRFQ